MAAGLEQADILRLIQKLAHRLGDVRIGVKHEVDDRTLRQLADGGGDGAQPFTPALAAVGGDEEPRGALAPLRPWKPGFDREQCVDRSVAGDVDLARGVLRAKVRRGQRGWREQQVGPRVDCGPIFLLGPGQERVMGPEPRLDMGDRHLGGEGGERRAKRARRIALDDQEVGRRAKPLEKRGGDGADVAVRVLLARATEPLGRKAGETKLVRVKAMLPGDDERGRKPALGERVRDGRQFDRFGPGADHQPDVGGIQPSP